MATGARDDARPLVSVLLIAYRQRDTVGPALRAALAQTYEPLEIIASDDASGDGTWEALCAAAEGYAGPHRLRLNRNEANLGIGAHLSRLAQMAEGELLLVAAGDDVSLPQRAQRTVEAWLAHDRRPDLIASVLADIDAEGRVHGAIVPSDLARYTSQAQWAAEPPHVVGAGQAWTRRLFERFGPLPPGTVAEDLVMVFRAIGSGGAITLREPLVQYRRGGISRRRRNLHARDVVARLLKNNRHALVEAEQMLRDAQVMGRYGEVGPHLERVLDRERFIAELFGAGNVMQQLRIAASAGHQPLALRLRLFTYAAMPWLLAPLFALKRVAARRRGD
ncbi:MAG: glycosyltransferase family 2 protein [Piscinibacter sp.]|uniref:glycosyltransferase family 2 protein n=1 Tax=Piscinibacter sp. TaxID=1903157 RepID=UPI003D0E87D3